jgi:hypothetical protein
MKSGTSLKVATRKSHDKQTPDQERFKYLLTEIDRTRKLQVEREAAILSFRRADSQHMQPLRQSLTTLLRDTVFAIDRTLEHSKWTRADRATLSDILRDTATMLLESMPTDAELKAIFDRHSPQGFDDSKREELERLKAEVEETMGLDLGDAEDIQTEDDLAQRLYEHMEKQKQEGERSTRRRKSSGQQRVEAAAQAAKQSIREMYRKLASAVHPDREPDAKRRAEKNELMQTINRAYAKNDLLTLLEAQMTLEQIDPDHIAKLSGARLAQYNKLLAEQLTAARKALQDVETGFRMDYGLEDEGKLTPAKLTILTRQRARGIRAEIERQKQFLNVLRDTPATKRWLKTQRRFAAEWLDDDE